MNMKQLINDNRCDINDINEKPRFAVVIDSVSYLPSGDIKYYDELIDVGNNFNPSTGVFTVGEEEEGTYVFLYSGRVEDDLEGGGEIDVLKNDWMAQDNE